LALYKSCTYLLNLEQSGAVVQPMCLTVQMTVEGHLIRQAWTWRSVISDMQRLRKTLLTIGNMLNKVLFPVEPFTITFGVDCVQSWGCPRVEPLYTMIHKRNCLFLFVGNKPTNCLLSL